MPSQAKAPTSIRPDPLVLTKLQKIAKINGLSLASVMNLCLVAGMNIVKAKLGDIRNASPDSNAATPAK